MRMRPFERPTVAQYLELRQRLAAMGCTAAHIRQAVGDAPQGRAIGTIADELRAWLKTRPKAQTGQLTPRRD